MKHLRLSTGFLLTAVAGGVFGVISVIFSLFTPTGLFGLNMAFYNTGMVCRGVLIWAVVCTALALWARSGLHAGLLVFCFVSSLWLTVTTLEVLRGYDFGREELLLQMLLLVPAGFCGCLVYRTRKSLLLRAAAVCCGGLFWLFDFGFCSGGEPFAVLTETVLLGLMVYCLFTAGAEARSQSRGYRFDFLTDYPV